MFTILMLIKQVCVLMENSIKQSIDFNNILKNSYHLERSAIWSSNYRKTLYLLNLTFYSIFYDVRMRDFILSSLD